MNNKLPLRECAVGIIPDGNRRWAKEAGVDLKVAYWIAMQRLATTIDKLVELGATSVAVFVLSKDNLRRPRSDLDAVLEAEERFFRDLVPSLKRRHSLKVFHAGRSDLLPNSYGECLNSICDNSADREECQPSLFLCAAYDPHDEILMNCSELAESSRLVSQLWVPVAIDLVIRTGGDRRLSGFLPLQCKYAELFFESYNFPEITADRVENIVREFSRRTRRFGG